jgi:hypothetical protein
MRKAFLILGLACLVALLFLAAPITGWASAIVDVSDSEVCEPQRIVVDEFLGGFAGHALLGEFNASENCEVQIDLTVYCSGAHTVKLKITGATQGTLFQAEGDRYNQTVRVNLKDSYNVTVSKSPFCSDVTVRGTIDILNSEEAPTSTHSPIESPESSADPKPTPTTSPTIPEFPPFSPVPLLMLATLAGALFCRKRSRRIS